MQKKEKTRNYIHNLYEAFDLYFPSLGGGGMDNCMDNKHIFT